MCAQSRRCCNGRENNCKTHRTKPQTARLHYLHCAWTNSFILSQNSAISGSNFTITLSWPVRANSATATHVPALSPNPECSVRAFAPSALPITKSKTIRSKAWQSHKPQTFLCQSLQLTERGWARIKVWLDPREGAGGLKNWRWQRTGLWAAVMISLPVPRTFEGYIKKKLNFQVISSYWCQHCISWSCLYCTLLMFTFSTV